jgi:hypothetical protein
MRTVYLLEVIDLVYCVVMQTTLTKIILVFAVCHINLFLFLPCQSDLTIAYLTSFYVFHFLYGVGKTVPHETSQLRSFHLVLSLDKSVGA